MGERQLEMVICGLANLENILRKERYNDELNENYDEYRNHDALLGFVHYLQEYVKNELI